MMKTGCVLFLVLLMTVPASLSMALVGPESGVRPENIGPPRPGHNPEGNTSPSRTDPMDTGIPLSYDDVLLIYNDNSQMSTDIKDYFVARRPIPQDNLCNITTSTSETVSRSEFEDEIRAPVESCIMDNDLRETVDYLITTKGVPLRVSGSGTSRASVDSELALILGPHNESIGNSNWKQNPYFGEESAFSHDEYGMYIVTRLTAFTLEEVKALIDLADNSTGSRGLFVLDEGNKGGGYAAGDNWITEANDTLSEKGADIHHDTTGTFQTHQKDVLGYISWGSNDGNFGSNYVSNRGMETDSNGDDIPDSWTFENDGGAWGQTNETSQGGSQSVKIVRPSVTTGSSAVGQYIDILPDTRYWVTGAANLSGVTGQGGAHLFIRTYDSDDQLVSQINGSTRTGTRNWYWMRDLKYEPVEGVSRIMVGAMLTKSSGTAYFDSLGLHLIKPNNTWVPGAIGETYVSTGGRSFNYGTGYGQSLVADLVREGISGVSGHVYEPYLTACGRPQILFDRYTSGYSMGESFWSALPFLSWMEVVVGDPKMVPYWDVPDPMVSNLTITPEDPVVGEEVTFSAKVSNRGGDTTDVGAAFFLGSVSQNNILDDPLDLTTMARGESAMLEASTIFNDTGSLTLNVMVDYEDTIDEQREGNNRIRTIFRVEDPPDLSIDPEDITFDPEDPLSGDLVNLTVKGSNTGGVVAGLQGMVNLTNPGPKGTLVSSYGINASAITPGTTVTLLQTSMNTTGLEGVLMANVTIWSSRTEADTTDNSAQSSTFIKSYGLSVEGLTDSLSVDPLATGMHRANITNTGNVEESLTFTYTASNPLWTIQVHPGELVLGPGETGTVTVSTFAPGSLDHGERVSIDLHVHSSNTDLVRDVNFVSEVAAKYELTMEVQETEWEAGPGEMVQMDVVLGNVGNVGQNVNLSADAPENWTVEFTPGSFHLSPGAYMTVLANVTVPKHALAGSVGTIDIRIPDPGSPGDMVRRIYVYVLPIHNISLTPLDLGSVELLPGNSHEVELSLNNHGNVENRVDLSMDPARELTSVLDEESLTIAPYDGENTTLTVSPSSLASPGSHSVRVRAIGQGGSETVAELTVTIRMVDLQLRSVTPSEGPLQPGDILIFEVVVKNGGDAALEVGNETPVPTIAMISGGTTLKEMEIGPLEPGVEATYNFSWEAEEGSWNFDFKADPEDVVMEAKEDNNRGSGSAGVLARPDGGGPDQQDNGVWYLAAIFPIIIVLYLVLKITLWSRTLKDAAARGEAKRAAEARTAAEGPEDPPPPEGRSGDRSGETSEAPSEGPPVAAPSTPSEASSEYISEDPSEDRAGRNQPDSGEDDVEDPGSEEVEKPLPDRPEGF